MSEFTLLWFLLTITFFVLEATTYNLTSIWFAIGSVAALVVSAFCNVFWIQLTVSLVISLILLIFTKPFAEKKLKLKKEPTNSDMVIGKIGIITKDITQDKFAGQVKVNGAVWSAVSKDNSVVLEGERVKIVSIDGVKLVVEREE